MPTDPDSPQVVASVANEIEAAAIVTALAAEGIEARAVGAHVSSWRAESPGEVTVVVRHADAARARQVLAEFR